MESKVKITPTKEQIIKELRQDIKTATKRIAQLEERLNYWRAVKEQSQQHLDIFEKDI